MTDARPGGVRGRLAPALPILPVLLAEAILWLGFGALLPVLPLYLVEQGIDTATLGWIVAAWPAARLVGRAGLRLARGPGRQARPHAGRPRRDRDRRPDAVARHRRARVHPRPRPGGTRHGRLRSGRPRLHHRCDGARGARGRVRPLLLGPDGRPPARPGHRRHRRRARRRLRLPVRLLQRRPASRRRSSWRSRRFAARRRGTWRNRPTTGAPRRRRGAVVALEPPARGGDRHQRRELLRVGHLRGHLEPLDDRSSAPTSGSSA